MDKVEILQVLEETKVYGYVTAKRVKRLHEAKTHAEETYINGNNSGKGKETRKIREMHSDGLIEKYDRSSRPCRWRITERGLKRLKRKVGE